MVCAQIEIKTDLFFQPPLPLFNRGKRKRHICPSGIFIAHIGEKKKRQDVCEVVGE